MKLHLADRTIPLLSGADEIANCGATVAAAHPVAQVEGGWGVGVLFMGDFGSFCGKCMEASSTPAPGRIYRYVLVSGEEWEQARGATR